MAAAAMYREGLREEVIRLGKHGFHIAEAAA